LIFLKKYGIIKEKNLFYRSGILGPLYIGRGRICGGFNQPIGHMRFTGKLVAYGRSLEVGENLHMGYTGRKIGLVRPRAGR
jgi:hypothetical protein